MKYNMIRFTGDYARLKSMGFTFQRLYAGNYMQWAHNDSGLRVWKRGAEMTIDGFTNHEGDLLSELLAGNLKLANTLIAGEPFARAYVNHARGGILTGDDTQYRAFVSESRDNPDYDFDSNEWGIVYVQMKLMRKLGEFNKLGWIEPVFVN